MVISSVGFGEIGFLIHYNWYKLAYHFDRQSGDMCEKFKACILFDSVILLLEIYLTEIIK